MTNRSKLSFLLVFRSIFDSVRKAILAHAVPGVATVDLALHMSLIVPRRGLAERDETDLGGRVWAARCWGRVDQGVGPGKKAANRSGRHTFKTAPAQCAIHITQFDPDCRVSIGWATFQEAGNFTALVLC